MKRWIFHLIIKTSIYWEKMDNENESLAAINSVLDLSRWDFEKNRRIALKGDRESELVMPISNFYFNGAAGD